MEDVAGRNIETTQHHQNTDKVKSLTAATNFYDAANIFKMVGINGILDLKR